MIHPEKRRANISALKAIEQSTPAQPISAQEYIFKQKPLRSMRLQLQDPATFEVTAIYLTRTDATRYRVKVFRAKKCLLAEYVEATSFAELINNISDKILNL